MSKIIEEKEIPVEKLYTNGENVRVNVGVTEITDLENSIEEHGILQRLVVRPGSGKNAGKYGVVIGGRRLSAARSIGLKKVPCVIKEFDSDAEALIESLEENVERENLSLDEEADAVSRLSQLGMTQDQIGKRMGRGVDWVKRRSEAKGLLDTLSKAGRSAHVHSSVLPRDSLKVATIAQTGKALFKDEPKRQAELFDALKDRPREEVARVVEHLKSKAENGKLEGPINEAVERVLKAPKVDISLDFDARLSKGIIRAAEDRGVSWEDIVRFAVEAWLKREKFL